ncbi:hypothetical protein QAD02_006548 [Eretmocerus hayati]|uniref:Uncharacterized protein n=1 Tax=Eretmocerus hayati TaxID=131215 RepID=A0ACC2N2E6_9HYME|nr:hypothetical protein QAD02_006548 [Eretmocerus hayati]
MELSIGISLVLSIFTIPMGSSIFHQVPFQFGHISDILKHQILQEKDQLYQITFFVNRKNSSAHRTADIILSTILDSAPSMIIDSNDPTEVDQVSTHDERRLLNFDVIIDHASDHVHRRISNEVNFLSKILPRKKTKKILVILADGYLSDTEKKAIFVHAWSKKFLDFSLISRHYYKCRETHEFLLAHYNPFFDVTTEELMTYRSKLFPDKLRDVNGYNFTLAVSSTDLETSIEYDGRGKIVNFQSPTFPVLRFMFKFMNFSIQFVEMNKNSSSSNESFSLVLDKLKRSEVNLVPVAKLRLDNKVFDDKVSAIDLDNNCINIKAAFPLSILKKESAHKIKSLFSLLFIPILVILIYWIVKNFKIQRENWELLDIFRIILSNPMAYSPRNNIDRLLLAGLIIVSSVFSNELYSQLLDVNYMRNKTKLDTFEKIERSKLKIDIPYGLAGLPFWDSDQYLRNIRKKSQVSANLIDCLRRFDLDASQICIASEMSLKSFMSSEYKKYRNPAFEIAEPVFNCIRFRYAFERSSPYAKRVKHLYRQIKQFGLDKILLSKYELNEKFVRKRNQIDANKIKSFPVQILYKFLAITYSASFFIFIVELAMKTVMNNKRP